ncbi:MAG: iron ABC transporter permease [Lachnospiraceae bacterium]|nr:iron ABC transporter permease [Lachnospiraceae bacterium]
MYQEIKKKAYRRYAFVFAGLLFVLLLLAILSLCTGSFGMTPPEVWRTLSGNGADETAEAVLFKIRLPRLLLAILLGGALSVSGWLLQTFFDNPLAGPYVLGISSGAKMAVSVVMVFFLGHFARISSFALILAAFAGSMLSTLFILAVARRTEHMAALLVAGIMVGYICSAISDFVITFAEEADIVNLHGWSRGSFASANMESVAWSFAMVLSAMAFLVFLTKPIGALRMGEAYAKSLGVSIRALRTALILLSGLLSATVTAFAGPVSFVGIAVPILMRRFLLTTEPKALLPGCFLGGALFCVGCDLIARTALAPTELLLSTVTALFGAPVVIAALFAKRTK